MVSNFLSLSLSNISFLFNCLLLLLIHSCLLFIQDANGTQDSVVAVRISRPDFMPASSSSVTDSVLLTITMPREYPHVAPQVSISSDSLHRQKAAQISAALAEEAERLVGQSMILDK